METSRKCINPTRPTLPIYYCFTYQKITVSFASFTSSVITKLARVSPVDLVFRIVWWNDETCIVFGWLRWCAEAVTCSWTIFTFCTKTVLYNEMKKSAIDGLPKHIFSLFQPSSKTYKRNARHWFRRQIIATKYNNRSSRFYIFDICSRIVALTNSTI